MKQSKRLGKYIIEIGPSVPVTLSYSNIEVATTVDVLLDNHHLGQFTYIDSEVCKNSRIENLVEFSPGVRFAAETFLKSMRGAA